MKLDTPEKIKAFLLINPKSTFINEDGKEYYIKANELVMKQLPYNSWEYVDNIRDRMIQEASKNKTYFDMELTWKRINQSDDYQLDRLGKSAKTPLEDFMYTSESDQYPKPEIIKFLANCFEKYFYMKGKVSLDEIFFGSNKRGIGNYAAQKYRNEEAYNLSLSIELEEIEMEFSKSKKIKRSELEIAEDTVGRMKLDIDPESLLRKYRRQTKGK